MDDDRTLYKLANERDEYTTITIDKFVADTLQQYLPDVHAWVQATYNRVAEKRPHLSRREKGDLVRVLAFREATNQLEAHGELNDLLP